MPLTKDQKKKIVEALEERISRQKAIVFVDFSGLKIKDLFNLRKKLKESSNEIKIAKKTLMKIAFKKAGLELDLKKMKGQIALVFGFKDEISPAKIVQQFSQENPKLKILGGLFENRFQEMERVAELAKLPTEEELLARLVESIRAPISNFVYVLKANIKGLVYVLSAIKK
jgi:large subunit ribosomal protein L10